MDKQNGQWLKLNENGEATSAVAAILKPCCHLIRIHT